MSQFGQSFRSPSPATGPQAVRGQERKGPVGSVPAMVSQQRPKSAAVAGGAKTSQAASRISPVSSGPPSNLQRRSPSQLNDRSSGGAFETKPATAGPKHKRSTLAQGSATAGRRPSVAAGGGGYGFISANGTPRTQYSDAATPRGQGAPYTPSVTVNPNFDPKTSQKSSFGLRHHNTVNAVKAGGIAYDLPEVSSSSHLSEAAGAATGQRRFLSVHPGGRRSMPAAASPAAAGSLAAIGMSNSLDVGYNREVGGSAEQQRHAITEAIGLLETSQLLQHDAVLRDIVQIIVDRLNAQHNEPQRVVVTTDNGTQVNSVDTSTQTEAPKFKEKRMRPLAKGKPLARARRGDGINCSLSDSDVPSDQTDPPAESHGMGRRRNSLDDMSLSTNSPRESCDGLSREASEASGPVSVSSMVQMSVASASSTDASQTTTLAHDHMTPLHVSRQGADHYDDPLEGEDGDQGGHEIEPFAGAKADQASRLAGGVGAGLEGAGVRSLEGLKERTLMHALNVNLNHCIGTYQSELEGINELANSPDGTPLSPSEKHLLAMSPSPSIQTLKELKRILDHHYSKLFQAGKLASPYGLGSPATAEMWRLGMESALTAEGGDKFVDSQTGVTPERPMNPDPTKWSPGGAASATGVLAGAQPSGPVIPGHQQPAPAQTSDAAGLPVPRNVRMGNSPPKNVKTPLTQSRVPTLNLQPTRRLEQQGSLESPISTPRSGSAFLAHINSARSSNRSSTNSGSASSTPRLAQGTAIRIESNGTGAATLTHSALTASAHSRV